MKKHTHFEYPQLPPFSRSSWNSKPRKCPTEYHVPCKNSL